MNSHGDSPPLEEGEIYISAVADMDAYARQVFESNRGRWTESPQRIVRKEPAPLRRGKVPDAAKINRSIRQDEKASAKPESKLPPKLQAKLDQDLKELEYRATARILSRDKDQTKSCVKELEARLRAKGQIT